MYRSPKKKTLAIMDLHNFMPFVSVSSVCLFTLPHCIRSVICQHRIAKSITRCFILRLFTSLYSMSVKSSKPGVFITCPKHFNDLSTRKLHSDGSILLKLLLLRGCFYEKYNCYLFKSRLCCYLFIIILWFKSQEVSWNRYLGFSITDTVMLRRFFVNDLLMLYLNKKKI